LRRARVEDKRERAVRPQEIFRLFIFVLAMID